MPNEVCRGDGKNRMDARTYRAMRLADLKKITEKRSYSMSQDSGEVSRKSDTRCESCDPSRKRQRVGLATQRQICSCASTKDVYTKKLARSPHIDGSPVSMEEGEINGAIDDVYSQETARSPQMDGSPGEIVGANEKLTRSPHMDGSPVSMEEGEINGANDDVYSQESARSPQMDGSLGEIVGANEDVYTQELARSPQMDGSPGEIVGANEDIYTQDLARSPQIDGSPISLEEGEIVGANENGIDASHDQSQLLAQGSPILALPAVWDNPRFRKYLLPVRLSVIQHDQSSVQASPKALPAGGSDNPRFREYWVPIRLSSIQLEQYCFTLMTNSGLLCSSAKKGNLNILNDVLCNLRKCCDHPYVLDPTLSAFSRARSPLVDHLSIDIPASGKLQLLSRFLPRIKEQGLRVLIVYKISSNSGKNGVGVGDILDDFLCQSFGQESYAHIYTSDSVPRKKKQAAIDLFNDKTSGRFVVLTGYKSSLASIRLSSVDVVILFNSEWNPVNDIRALQKMTLDTEKDHLRVFRLYSVCTLEEKALGLARNGAAVKIVTQSIGRITCNMLLAWGAAYLFEKLDALHAVIASEETSSSEYDDFLCNVINELSTILSSNIDDPSISCSVISKVSEVGKVYPGNVKLHGEVEVQSLDDVPPNVFWSSLLDDRSPRWRFLPEEPESVERRIPLCDREIPGWSRGNSNAKRSKRSRRCVWSFERRLQEREEMALTKDASSKLAGESVSIDNGMTSPLCSKSGAFSSIILNKSSSPIHLADCMAQGTETNLSVELMGLSSVNNDISEHIQKIDETHKRQMRELTQKQGMEVLTFFKTKKETRETMKKVYELQKVLICELYGESLPITDQLKKLDEKFRIKFEGLNHEMNKCWESLRAAHETARSSEEEMRSKMIDLLKSTAGTLLEDSDGAMVTSPSISLDIIEVSPHCSPMADVLTIPVDTNEQTQKVSAPGSSSVEELDALVASITSDDPLPVCSTLLHSEIDSGSLRDSQGQVIKDLSVSESQDPRKNVQDVNDEVGQLDVEDLEISLDCWTIEGVTLQNDQNQASQGLLSSSVPITDGQPLKESDQFVSNGVVPVVEAAVPVSSSRKQVDVLSAPVTPDNLSASDRSPLPESELGANILKKNQNQALENAFSCSFPITESQGHLDGMRSSDEFAVPSDKIGCFPDSLCKDTPNICVISDDEQMHEISASTPVGELQETNNLSEEVPGTTSSEQLNPFSVGCSTNEQAACLPSMGNQHEETQRMSNGVSTGGSSQPLQSSARESLLRLDMSEPYNAISIQTDNCLRTSQVAGGTEENTRPHLSYTGRNYYLHNSRSPQPASFDPLQVELEEIHKAADEALKKHRDMVGQFAADRDHEIAQICQKYSLLYQEAESALMQKKEELKVRHEKTKAHKLLADAWRLLIQENSPLDIMVLPPSLVQSTDLPLANGMMQTNASTLFPQFANQFSDMAPTDQIVRPHYPPSYHPFYNSQGGWGPYIPNQHLRSAPPAASFPFAGFTLSQMGQMNQHALNFCSSGSSAGGSYSQPYSFRDYLAPPYNAPI